MEAILFFRIIKAFFYPIYLFTEWLIKKLQNNVVAAIPIIGPMIRLFFLIIDFGKEKLEFALSLIVSLGCFNPVEDITNNNNNNNNNNKKNLRGGALRMNALLLKFIPKLKDYINQNSSNQEYINYLKKKYKINDKEKDLVIDLLNGGGNKEFEKNFKTLKKNINGCNISIQVPMSNNAQKEMHGGPDVQDIIEEQIDEDPSNLVCCTDENFKRIYENLKKTVEDDPVIKAFFENPENHRENFILQLIYASLDNEQLKIYMDCYHTSGIITKLTGCGLYGPIAKYYRLLFCNVLSLTKEAQVMFRSMGGIENLADAMKSGVFAGSCNIVTYIVLLIFFIIITIF